MAQVAYGQMIGDGPPPPEMMGAPPPGMVMGPPPPHMMGPPPGMTVMPPQGPPMGPPMGAPPPGGPPGAPPQVSKFYKFLPFIFHFLLKSILLPGRFRKNEALL